MSNDPFNTQSPVNQNPQNDPFGQQAPQQNNAGDPFGQQAPAQSQAPQVDPWADTAAQPAAPQAAPQNDPFGGQQVPAPQADPFGGQQAPAPQAAPQNNPFGGQQAPAQPAGPQNDPFGGQGQGATANGPLSNLSQGAAPAAAQQPASTPTFTDDSNPFGVRLLQNAGTIDVAKGPDGKPLKYNDLALNRISLGKNLRFLPGSGTGQQAISDSIVADFLIIDQESKQGIEYTMRVFNKAPVEKLKAVLDNNVGIHAGKLTRKTSKGGNSYFAYVDLSPEELSLAAQVARAKGFWPSA